MSHKRADCCSYVHWFSPSSKTKREGGGSLTVAASSTHPLFAWQSVQTLSRSGRSLVDARLKGHVPVIAQAVHGKVALKNTIDPALPLSGTPPTCCRCGNSWRCARERWTSSDAICPHQSQTMTLRRTHTLQPRNEKRGTARGEFITEQPVVRHVIVQLAEFCYLRVSSVHVLIPRVPVQPILPCRLQ